jgi:FkbM family methyltransferase
MTSAARLRQAYAAGALAKADYIARMHDIHAGLYEYASLLGGDVAAVELAAGAVTYVSRDGVRFRCDPADTRAAPIEALNFGGYEGDDAALFWSLLKPGAVLFDVGAHVGWYALHAAARYPDARVVAFEPVARSCALLRENVALNRLTNLTICAFGLADRPGERPVYVPAGLPTAASSADLTGAGVAHEATFRSLDDVADELGLTPDVIKIDVEGAELAVLRGAARTLARRPVVYCEMLRKWTAAHGSHPDETLRFMASHGYTCHYRDGVTTRELHRMTDDVSATNFVFRPRGDGP